MMNFSMIQENWATISRKFPIICVIEIKSFSEMKELLSAYTSQFDHVFALMPSNTSVQEIDDFWRPERIINLSVINADNLPNLSLEEKSQQIARGQMILLTVKKNKKIDKNIRWLVYDRVKEMKSPITDSLLLDDEINYVLEDESFVAKLRIDNQ